MPPAERYHALDSLRGFAMFLGVALHAGVAYTITPVPFWSIRDANSTPLVDLFLFAIHDFRMQVFFLLAGFFGCLLYQKYGVLGTAWHRVKRVGVPFVLGLVFIVPTVMAVFLYAELDAVRTLGVPENATPVRKFAADLIAAEPDKSNAALVLDRFTSGDVAGKVPLAHLWFLYDLLILYTAVLLAGPLLARLSGTRALAALDRAFRGVVEGRWRVVLPALVTLPVLMLMTSPFVDTQFRWAPEWHLVLYYAGFFGFGWMLYRHRDLVEAFGRGWKAALVIANLLVLPVAVGCAVGWALGVQNGRDVTGWRFGGFVAQAFYTWLMIVGLWGAFLRFFAGESAWARYLADSSYWCYLASLTPTAALQFVLKDWPLPGEVKWLVVTVVVTAGLLVSYEWCVRYTIIGAILNGRKERARRTRRANAGVEPQGALTR